MLLLLRRRLTVTPTRCLRVLVAKQKADVGPGDRQRPGKKKKNENKINKEREKHKTENA
jgi:hypothetical protein